LIWISHKKERNLKLSSVSQIISGQRTVSNNNLQFHRLSWYYECCDICVRVNNLLNIARLIM